MELKKYQQEIITDLDRFLEHIQQTKIVGDAFHNFWTKHPRTPLQPFPGKAIEPYKDNVKRVPHVCVKVPTAGGKTFIACNALKTIFNAFDYDRPKAVLWLVPSITILDQTIKNLRDNNHPYRQKINSHFGNKVEVFDKAALLQGTGFNATSVKEQLNIMIFSFDSLRAKNKEDRKVFQENGNLQSFEHIIAHEDELTLGSVIKYLNPIVVVDESHNAESELSVEMLQQVNPCFILDLTATPRKNSNIISFIDAIELKKDNMVKLPVIVYNHQDKTEVINSALQLQRKLELQAIEDEKNGGKYIRPIVLFQAQPRNADDNTTFEKLKEKLIELKIPAEQIKIKTANINELKEFDNNEKYPNGLMDKACKVRYIITINALKEGWDCPFAYILAPLADKSSAVDVEQILGRVLRLPNVSKNKTPFLNFCYVITASAKFMDTLQNIVKGLNKAGFSDKDYKLVDEVQIEEAKKIDIFTQLELTPVTQTPTVDDITADINLKRIIDINSTELSKPVEAILKQGLIQNEAMEKEIADSENSNILQLPNELNDMVKRYDIKDVFKEQASKILIPQFYLKIPAMDLFGMESREIPLDKENLLEDFKLGKADFNFSFDSLTSELYKVDLDETKNDHTPTFVKIDGDVKERVLAYILDPARKSSRIKNISKRILDLIGNMYPIDDREIETYINKILETFSDEQFKDFADHEYSYVQKIKDKINSLASIAAEKAFRDFLDIDKLFLKPSYILPQQIAPNGTGKDITKSLYEKEVHMNSFEESVINEIANIESILFWTKNIEKKGFCINGFINHYPDFIIQTKSGKTIVLETKGDDRDNSDSETKIRLGSIWANKASGNFKYFMVFDKRELDGAYRLDEFINLMKKM